MVILFKSQDPNFLIYMGRDKYENEELLKWAFPIDVWFHVEDLSSAHVYLRLPEDVTIDTIPQNILVECCQLVKDNSKDGRKKDKVSVCYTPWENLLKRAGMEIGEVSFKDEKNVRVIHNITKDGDLLKALKKTQEEKNIDLEAEKLAFQKELTNKRKKLYEEQKKIDAENTKKNKAIMKDKTYGFMEDIAESTTNKVIIIL
jgi:hypothetical protein